MKSQSLRVISQTTCGFRTRLMKVAPSVNPLLSLPMVILTVRRGPLTSWMENSCAWIFCDGAPCRLCKRAQKDARKLAKSQRFAPLPATWIPWIPGTTGTSANTTSLWIDSRKITSVSPSSALVRTEQCSTDNTSPRKQSLTSKSPKLLRMAGPPHVSFQPSLTTTARTKFR